MANTAGVSNSFKLDLVNGTAAGAAGSLVHAWTADTFKMALYLASASIDPTTAAYTATGEVANSGTYAAGGQAIVMTAGAAVAGVTPPVNSVIIDPSTRSLVWTGFSATAFDTALLYNSSKSGKAIAVFNFGSQTITAGTLTLTMPTVGVSTSLLAMT